MPRLTRRSMIAGPAAALVVMAASITSPSASARDAINIVATTGMIADAARQVGGDLVRVRALMGPGVDPHAYRQTRSDIVALTKADLVLWHGLYLEAQLQEFIQRVARRGNVVAVADALPKDLLIAHNSYADKFDPHVWMVPGLWSRIVVIIRDTLIAKHPAGEATFRANATKHIADLEALATYTDQILKSVPAKSRVLLTAHDAFKYFGRAYDFDVIGIQGISTESEAGLKRVRDLVDLIVARDIRAVFVESSVSDRNIRALIEGAAAKGHTVTIGGELFSDAMGAPATYEGTYIGMIDHNTTIISRALGGSAPPKGMAGRLS